MSFKNISKKDWLVKTEADLKGKALSNLDWVISENIIQSAMIHKEDVDHENISPIQTGKSNNHWKIGESIQVNSNVSEANELAIQTLEGGATSLAFYYQDVPDLRLLLKDINLEWINTYFYGDESIIDSFVKVVGAEKNLNLVNCGFFNTPIQESSAFAQVLPLAKFHQIDAQESQNTAEVVHSIAKSYTGIIQAIDDSQIEFLNRLFISIPLSDHFLVNIAMIRACKLVLQQIINELNLEVNLPKIKVSVAESSLNEDADYNKIKMTPHALSGIIGGVDEVYLPPSSTANEQIAFNRRISRNVNHLLELESFLGRVVDPAAGSYYLETLTDQIAKEAWLLLQNNQIRA